MSKPYLFGVFINNGLMATIGNSIIKDTLNYFRYLLMIPLFVLLLNANQAKAQIVCPETPTVDFVFENFNALTDFSVPANWCTNFRVEPVGGISNSKRFSRLMFDPATPGYWQTPPVQIDSDALFGFSYRVLYSAGYPNSSGPPGTNFSIGVSISDDNGATFTPLVTINDVNHIVSNNYTALEFDLAAYQGKNVIIRAVANYISGSFFYVDFDNVFIGSFSDVSFLVKNTSLIPVENASIIVDGFTQLVTNSNGEASTRLPDGNFTFSVSATNYLTFTNGSFLVSGVSHSVPEILLIGDFHKTFTVTNQNAVPIANASIQYIGLGDGYGGTKVPVSGTVLTNSSGIASVRIRNGIYDFSASRINHYTQTGSFTMDNNVLSTDVVLQQHPLVTFNVTDLESDPISGAAIGINTLSPINTDIAGLANIRLPIGTYNLQITKIGFFPYNGTFDILTNDDLSLPVISLEPKPPTFAFVGDIANGVVYPKTLAGQVSRPIQVSFINEGSGSITIKPEDITISGVDASSFVLSEISETISLGTGDSFTVSIVFSPVLSGQKIATLEIEDNIGGKALNVLDISGVAYDPVEIPFFEDFSSGDFSNWVVDNTSQINKWHVGEPFGLPGNQSAIVSNDGGLTNQYQSDGFGATSRSHFFMDFDIPAADPGEIFLRFNWKGNGESFRDYMRVYIIEPTELPLAGTLLSNHIGTFAMQPALQQYSYTVPSTHFGKTRRIVFTWINDASGGIQPPASVDNIYIGKLYTLATNASPAGLGTVTGAGTYGGKVPVPVSATAAPGYAFSHWSATAGSFADANSAETKFTMPGENATITANFTPALPVVDDLIVTYNGTEQTIAATAPAGFTIIWYDAAENGNLTNAPKATNSGTYTAWAAVRDGDNNESPRVQATLTINAAEITITATDASKEFGDDDPTLEFAITQGELFGNDAFSGALTREPGEDVGVYYILQGTLSAGSNYTITFVPAEFTITPGLLTVTATPATKVYGENDPTLEFTITQGSLAGDDAFSGALTREPGEDVGTYDILQGTLSAGNNYTITFVPAEFTITPGLLTVTATPATKIYGENDPALEFTITQGSLAGDDAFTGALTREPGEDVGTYDILQGTLSAGTNYTITFVTAQFTITPKELTIGGTFAVADKEPDGTTSATITSNLLTLVGVVTGDYVSLTGVTAAFAQAQEGDDIVVSIATAELAGNDKDNYTLSLEGAPATTASIRAVVVEYVLTLSVVPSDGGTVTGAGTYPEGTIISLVATPAANHIFVAWEDAQGTSLSTDPNYSYTMPGADAALTARFQFVNTVEQLSGADLSIYPNPARDHVRVVSGKEISHLQISDLTGRIVYSNTINDTEVRIGTGDLPSGLYLMRIHTSDGIQVRRLQVQR